MNTINALVAAEMELEECTHIIAGILKIPETTISTYDVDNDIEHRNREEDIRIVYNRLRGNFALEINLYFIESQFVMSERDFADLFSRRSGSACAIETSDGHPFTYILFEPERDLRIVEIDDDYRISEHEPKPDLDFPTSAGGR